MTSPPPDREPIDTAIGPLASRLLSCLCEQLETTLGGPVTRCCLYPGNITSMDACCVSGDCTSNGMAAVRLVNLFPTRSFPRQTTDFTPCTGIHWAATLEMSVFRCVHEMSDNGCPPSCADVTRDALVAIDDSLAMRRAVACCLGENGVPCSETLVPGQWTPVLSGGCGGGQMQVTVDVGSVCCPRPQPPAGGVASTPAHPHGGSGHHPDGHPGRPDPPP